MVNSGAVIAPEALSVYLAGLFRAPVEILTLQPLKGASDRGDDPKGFGYGVPFEVECLVDGVPRALVVSRTRPAQGFGHDYPADRAWQALYGHVAYNSFPAHVKSLDVGFVRESGELVSVADAGEFFQLVEKAGGQLYWLDLDRMLHAPAMEIDTARTLALARFLAEAHAVKRREPTLYQRRIRELVAHGECLMGILDSYPDSFLLLPFAVREAIERGAISWRWGLHERSHRLARVHGDFHPWNILFREGTDFSVLDRSRGEWGEPADDVAALGVNYLFFGLRKSAVGDAAVVAEPFLGLFRTFVASYLAESGDREILEVLPPFFAFRALVLAHPRWYPSLTDPTRASLIRFARRMLERAPFDLETLPAMFWDVR